LLEQTYFPHPTRSQTRKKEVPPEMLNALRGWFV
jgi:hypothetical protein